MHEAIGNINMLYFLMILNLSDCLKFIFPAPFLLEKLKAKNQVYLVKHLINESRKCFSLDAESTYSNILKDLFDLLEELEHGVYPSIGSLDFILSFVVYKSN